VHSFHVWPRPKQLSHEIRGGDFARIDWTISAGLLNFEILNFLPDALIGVYPASARIDEHAWVQRSMAEKMILEQ
jgi:hypothetical protein